MANEKLTPAWPIEEIPDGDDLYMGIHRMWFRLDGALRPGAFKNQGEGMSSDWSKYSTPTETRMRRRTPNDNAVVRLNVGQVRMVPGQRVSHEPLPGNRAHAEVFGDKDEEARLRLHQIAQLALTVPA